MTAAENVLLTDRQKPLVQNGHRHQQLISGVVAASVWHWHCRRLRLNTEGVNVNINGGELFNSNDVQGDDQDWEEDMNAQIQDLASALFRIRLNFHSIELSGEWWPFIKTGHRREQLDTWNTLVFVSHFLQSLVEAITLYFKTKRSSRNGAA